MSRHVGYVPGEGLPLGIPSEHQSSSASSQVRDLDREIRGTNTPLSPESATSRNEARQQRISRKRLGSLIEQMVDRDHHILRTIADHRFVTSIQLQHLIFTTHESDASAARTTRRVLSRLERWTLIRQLDRRVGGAIGGSTPRVWQLAPAGARLVAHDGTTYRVSEPSLRFLRHCLAVADVHVLLQQHRAIEAIEGVAVEVEPQSWRRFTGLGGEPRWLQPDLAATVLATEYEDRWFIEVDLGTESLPTLLRKCGHYEDYRASGQEQDQHSSFPLVLWLFTDQRRADKLRAAVARSPRLTPELYRFAAPSTIAEVLSGGAS